jgi:GNAT superfamily N-acetyltransferase
VKKDAEFTIKNFDGNQSDYHFVLSGWLESYKKNGFVFGMPRQRYYEAYRPHVMSIIKESKIAFAVSKTDPDHLYGFIVYRLVGGAPIISFVYVKHLLRKLGIGGALITFALDQGTMIPRSGFCTHIFKWLDEKLKKYNLVYDPFLDLKLSTEEKKAS